MRQFKQIGVSGIAIALALAATTMGCVGTAHEEDMGSIGMELQIAPGVTVNAVNWTISNPATGFSRTGAVNVRFSNTVSFQVSALPATDGYTIALTATSADGSFTCSGSAGFKVVTGMITSVGITLNCSTAPAGQGTVVVTGTTQICANLDSLGASPLETAVDTQIALSATGSAGTVPVTFAWTATAGTFDNATSATPNFTCPSTAQQVTITVTVSPSAATCNTVFTSSVVVTCDTLNPTFTNVYASIIGVRCIGCHRPGGGGLTVGMLDMSTPTVAYNSLVGVPGQGIGAGTSGVTCASLSPPAIRVAPNDSANSLLFDKVHSKQLGVPPRCGSGMPLPGGAAPLTAAQTNLIAAWIDSGAPNN